MGQFDKDDNGCPLLNANLDNGPLKDKQGRSVNPKGYLVDPNDNIIDSDGKLLFPKACLNDEGDFPKIFPFTKFNPNTVEGTFDRDPSTGAPILHNSQENGKPVYKDNKGRPVNPFGYLIDPKTGDVIDQHGNLVFPKGMLDPDTQIPPVFRSGQLKDKSGGS